MKLKDLEKEYDKLQEKYGAEELTSIYNGGCSENPEICFVFMNPTGRNIASSKNTNLVIGQLTLEKKFMKMSQNINIL